MGKLVSGINGPIIGKVGDVVGSSWKGIPYLKGKYKKRTKNVSDKELANRERFAKAQAWLAPIKEYVREGFRGYSQLSEGFVAAKSYLMKNAMEGEMFDVTINPALVRVSFGDLRLPTDITVTLKDGNILEFNWNPDSSGEDISRYDQAMLLAYNVEREKMHKRLTGEFRKTGKMELELTTEQSGQTYHIYFAMAAHDRSRRSNSVYLGTITT